MQYLTVHGNKIAYLKQEGEGTPLFWCGGFKSDMSGTKAQAFANSTMPLTRFDYSGHGASEGDFTDGTISKWLDEAEVVYNQTQTKPAVIIGSSMGGWIALLLAKRVKALALLLIAPAPDFTQKLMWDNFSDDIKAEIMEKGFWMRSSPYDDSGYPITKRLIEDGCNNLLLDVPFNPGCPVHIVTGSADEDVPVEHVIKLVECLPATETTFTLVQGGDHRLSTPDNIALLLRSAERLR